MDKESSRGIGMRLLAPRQNKSQSYLFRLPSTSTGLGQGRCWKINPGKSTAVRRSCVPPPFYRHLLITNSYTYTHIHTYIKICIHLPTPDPSPPSLCTASLTSGSVTSANLGCRTGWLLAGAGLPPLLQSRVSMLWLCAFVAEVFFLFSHCTPQGVWGLFFFSSPSSCYAVFFFNSLSSCPVYPLVILYVCCMDRLMANLWLVTIKGYYYKGLLRWEEIWI